jgi:hypothetical protein
MTMPTTTAVTDTGSVRRRCNPALDRPLALPEARAVTVHVRSVILTSRG